MSNIIDFHSHILPGIDDGSASVEESVAMLQVQMQHGIGQVIATPHFYAQHDTVERFLRRRAESEELLRGELRKHPGLPSILIGAEVQFFRGISDVDLLQELTIDGKQCILIEMPHAAWTDSMYRELEGIYTKRGLTPIIAHVERYIGRFRTFGIPERLAELPVLVQANSSFFCNRGTAPQALRMLRRDQIHLLGSDCHNMGSRRPSMGPAVERIEKSLGLSALAQIEAHQTFVMNG